MSQNPKSITKTPAGVREQGMPTKESVNNVTHSDTGHMRPYTVFYVNPETPEEVHTDMVMAHDREDATRISSHRHKTDVVLHVRGIGDNTAQAEPAHYPCARFINGEFRRATFSDEPFLDS